LKYVGARFFWLNFKMLPLDKKEAPADLDVSGVCAACGTSGTAVFGNQHFATVKTTLPRDGSAIEDFDVVCSYIPAY
jgi:hypothetical protein